MLHRYLLAPLTALLLLAAAPAAVQAQTANVGIGTTAPDASAALDIVSTSKGLLLPRVAAAAGIASPAPGLLVYQIGAPAGFYYNSGTAAAPAWQQISTTASGDNLGSHTATQSLKLNGNTLSNNGTGGVRIDNSGNMGIGTASPGHPLAVQAGAASNSPLLGFYSQAGNDKYNFSLQGGGLNLSESNVAGGRLFVQDGGNVGIGTASPTQALDVSGTARLRGLSGSGSRLPVVLPDGTLGINAPVFATAPAVLPTGATSSVTIARAPRFMAVSGTTAYVTNASNGRLQVFNLAAPGGPVLIGSVEPVLDVMGRVTVSGTRAYVIYPGAMRIFDVATPSAPVLVGTVSTAGGAVSVTVSGTRAYVVDNFGHSLQIFDVATPSAPTLLGTVSTGFNPKQVVVSGSLAYVVAYGSNKLQVFNVATPSAPVLLAEVATAPNPRSLALSGTRLYVLNAGFSGTLQAFDVATPSAPTLLGTVAAGSRPEGIVVSGSRAYTLSPDDDRLSVYNVATAGAPVLLGSLTTDDIPMDLAVSGSTAYVLNFNSSTLQVFSLPTPTRTVTVGPDGSFSSEPAPSGADFIQNGTAQQAGADFNITGNGTLGGRAVAAVFQSGAALPINSQGAHLQWNRSGFEGETWLINQRGGGNEYAGVRFGKSDAANNVTEWARFIDNGNLGLGTGTPDARLDIESSDPQQLILTSTSTDPTGIITLNFPATNSVSTTSTELLVFKKAGHPTAIGQIVANLGNNTVSYATASDRRLKEHIAPTHYGLSDLLQLRVKDYNFIGTPAANRTTGLLAQELFKVYPDAVKPGDTGATVTDAWAVDYGKLTPLLVQAIQDQQRLIETQRGQLDALTRQAAAAQAEAAGAKAQAAQATATLETFEARLRRLEAGGAQAPQ